MTSLRFVAVILGLLFAAFVWPTLHRYEEMADGKALLRINRVTGSVDWLICCDGDWEPARPAQKN